MLPRASCIVQGVFGAPVAPITSQKSPRVARPPASICRELESHKLGPLADQQSPNRPSVPRGWECRFCRQCQLDSDGRWGARWNETWRNVHHIPRVHAVELADLRVFRHDLCGSAKPTFSFPQTPASISAGLMGPIGVLVTIGALRTTRRYASSRLIKIAGNRLCPIGTSIGPIFLKPNAS
jgi:hypothetical protein